MAVVTRLLARRRRALLAIAAVGLAVAGACGRGTPSSAVRDDQEAVPVAAQQAQVGSIRTVVRASGVVVPAEGAEFLALAPMPARVLEVTKVAGEEAVSGEVLVRFELPSASQDVARQQAEAAGAQARWESARIAHDRTQEFVERGLVPRRDLETAARELDEARVAVERARAGYAAAEEAAARAVIRAPFDGIVAQRMHDPGDLVSGTSADPVLRLVDPDRLEVAAVIASADIARVLPGATARVTSPLEAQSVSLSVPSSPRAGAVDGDAPALTVRLALQERATLAVDTRLELEIDAEERSDVVFVPIEAIVGSGDDTAAFVAAGDRAERRPVTLGLADAQRIEVTAGITAGELVITRGQIGLIDGARISVAVGGP